MAQSFVVSKLSDSKLQLKLCPVKSCVICGEEGATPHWNGVLSCEGCATFYQRTIKKQRQYVCRFQGKCLVRNMPPHKICRLCRYKKCKAEGMKPGEIIVTGCASTSSPECAFSSHRSLFSGIAHTDHVSRVLILENCVFVSCLCPAFVLPYLREEDDAQLLNVATANFTALIKSTKHYPITERFYSLFVETAECLMPDDPIFLHQIRMILEQYVFASAEIIKTQIKSEVEFASLCQMTTIKIAGEQSQTNEIELTNFVNRVSESYRNCCRESNELFTDSKFWNLITATNKIHSYRQSTKKQIFQILRKL